MRNSELCDTSSWNSNTAGLQSQYEVPTKEREASDVQTSRKVDYLRDEVALRLCERLLVRMLS
jgi:NADH dehydrogenase [ubiquinone] 1 alpha subcomplex assembly factor 5